MDCQQIVELLDGYALGGADPSEAREIETHVADCVRCWEELTKAQRTAALLALSVPIHEVPARLEQRIIADAQRDKSGIRKDERAPGWQRLRWGWPVASGGLAAVSAAAVVFAAILQVQVSDLKNENDNLKDEMVSNAFAVERQLAVADSRLEETQTIFTVLADQQKQAVEVEPFSDKIEASAAYTWSPATGKGYVECSNLPQLPPGKVYQVWVTAAGEAYPIAAVSPQNGWCLVAMDLSFLESAPGGIGISVENIPGGIERPAGGWLLYAHFPD